MTHARARRRCRRRCALKLTYYNNPRMPLVYAADRLKLCESPRCCCTSLDSRARARDDDGAIYIYNNDITST